jgi:hypothetical protein
MASKANGGRKPNGSAVAKRSNGSPTVVAEYQIMRPDGQDALRVLHDALAPGESFGFGNLERVGIPPGGGKNWELPSGEAVRTLQGVIIHRQPVRAFWADAFQGEGTPPDCTSSDNIRGFADEATIAEHGVGGECNTCPKGGVQAWGTARGPDGESRPGKACRQITRLFLLQPESVLPLLISIPPSSYKSCQDFVLRNAGRGYPPHAYVTRIELEQTKSKDGISYSRTVFKEGGLLAKNELDTVLSYRGNMLPLFEAVAREFTDDDSTKE